MTSSARERVTCVGSKGLFGPRCGAEVSYRAPIGPLCAACAERSMEAIKKGGTLLNVLAAARGISVEEMDGESTSEAWSPR